MSIKPSQRLRTLPITALLFVSAFSCALVSSCSSIPIQQNNEVLKHVISIGSNGKLNDIPLANPTQTHLKQDRPASGMIRHKNANAHFQRIFEGIRDFPRNTEGEIEVLLYVHGGLNSKVSSMNRAAMNYRCITKDKQEPKYPVFINWETGPLRTYTDHLVSVRQGEPSNLAPYTSPVYLLTDVANSIVNAPKSWLINGEHSWRSTFFRKRRGVDNYLEKYKSGDQQVLYVGNGKKGTLVRRAQWLATSPAKILTTPFTYTMAKPAWDVMLRRSSLLFNTADNYRNPNHQLTLKSPLNDGALPLFLRQFNAFIKQENLPVNITLVGHSMGAIVTNRMLTMDIDLPYKNIVHMGSADSIRNLFYTVIPYLNKASHKKTNFYSMSLHPENEDREANFMGTVPSGSLLVWIDNMYTIPETVIDKRSGRWVNMEKVIPTIPANVRDQMYFKIFGLHSDMLENSECRPGKGNQQSKSVRLDDDEKLSQPLQHGDFDKLYYWRRTTWWK